MSVKNFFSAYFDSLSDLETRHSFLNEMRSKLVEDQYFNFYAGKKSFLAVILSLEKVRPVGVSKTSFTAETHTAARVRPIDIHDFLIPEPCNPDKRLWWTDSGIGYAQELVKLHPLAYSQTKDLSSNVTAGSIVECYYDIQGPDHEGIQRGLRFKTTHREDPRGFFSYDCLKKGITSSATRIFNNKDGTRSRKKVKPKPKRLTPKEKAPASSPNRNWSIDNLEPIPLSDKAKRPMCMFGKLKQSDPVLIFGDSQLQSQIRKGENQGTLGTHLMAEFEVASFTNVNLVAKESKDPSYYVGAGWSLIDKYVSQNPKMIIISLGGNGIKGARKLLARIKSVSPDSMILWFGPLPMATDGYGGYDHVTHTPIRQANNESLKAEIGEFVHYYLDGYRSNSAPTYTCNGECDGLHMIGTEMQNLAYVEEIVFPQTHMGEAAVYPAPNLSDIEGCRDTDKGRYED